MVANFDGFAAIRARYCGEANRGVVLGVRNTGGHLAAELRHEHEFLQYLAQCLRDREVDATALLVEGATIKTLLEESERLDSDLVILGCHRHGLIYGALMDVTEEGILSKCARPIMFVPVPE